jgi:predicted HAD superfamily phosphohydrolase YqeG
MDTEGKPETRDWLQTARQTIPHAMRVARSLAPTFKLDRLTDLDETFVEREGIDAILWDVDGTLTHYHGGQLAPEVYRAASELFEHRGLRHAIVSNCDDIRLAELGRMFPALPVLKVYMGDAGLLGREVLRGHERWFRLAPGGAEEASPPDRRLTPVRKPSPDIIRFALHRVGTAAGRTVMVGDQLWTDVAGANLGGIRSIHIPTVGRSTFPAPLRLFQRIEGWVRRILA